MLTIFFQLNLLKNLFIFAIFYFLLNFYFNSKQFTVTCAVGAVKYNAATAATRCTDTVKVSGKNKFIDHTENRDHVWLAQTPQVFNCDLYRAASYIAAEASLSPTDDNFLIENVNHKVKLVECGKYNIKITTPEDLIIAGAILNARETFPATLPEDTDEE